MTHVTCRLTAKNCSGTLCSAVEYGLALLYSVQCELVDVGESVLLRVAHVCWLNMSRVRVCRHTDGSICEATVGSGDEFLR